MTPPTQHVETWATRIVACSAFLALALPSARASEILLLNVFSSKGSFSYQVPFEKVNRLPKWNSTQDRPPLDIGRAINIAANARSGGKPNGTKAALQEVKLSRTGLSEPALVWFYQVSFEPTGQASNSSNALTIILMDGTIVTPKFQKVPVK